MQAVGKGGGIAAHGFHVQENGELITGHPPQRVRRFQHVADPLRHDREQGIAHLMPPGVVDAAKTVNIHNQQAQGRFPRVALAVLSGVQIHPRQSPLQPVEKQGAVGKARYPVAHGIGQQALLALPVGGDVMKRA